MLRLMEKWRWEIKQHRGIYLFALFLFFSSVACGYACCEGFDEATRQRLSESALGAIKDVDAPASFMALMGSLWHHGKIASVMVLLGCLPLGAPFVLLCQGIVGLGTGVLLHTASSAISGWGIFAVLCYLLPQSLFYVPGYVALCVRAVRSSIRIFRGVAGNRIDYFVEILPYLCTIMIGIVIEWCISPRILRLFVA